MNDDGSSGNMPDKFDRTMGSLHGLPDVVTTKPSTIREQATLIGTTGLYIVQTYRQREKGDTIFLEYAGKEGLIRLVIPPKVADAIAAQRDSLTGRVRSKAAKATAQARRDRGELPFIRKTAAE